MICRELMPVFKEYAVCPKCGSDRLGKGLGSISINLNSYNRTCSCGFSITVKSKRVLLS